MAERKSPAVISSKTLPKVEEPESSTSQPKVPAAQVRTLLVWQVARPAPLKRAVKRLEEEAVVLKKLVVVALVPENFCKVVEPITSKSPEVLMVEVAKPPIAKELPEKTEAKRLVVVALVEVELAARKEPVESMRNSSVPASLVKLKNLPVKLLVEEALMRMPVVPVAFTWKRADLSRERVVVAPTTKDL